MSSNLTRRDFLKMMAASFLQLTVLSALGGLYGAEVEIGWIEIVQKTIKLPRLHPAFDGFRITQISDIHMGGWMNRERLEHVVDLVNASHPDLILMTGDFIESTPDIIRNLESVRDLQIALTSLAPVPSLAILGNQDYRANMVINLRIMFEALKILDVTNRVYTVSRGEGRLHFAGIDDIIFGAPDLNSVFAELPENEPAILLAHEPDFADISSRTGRFDMQISGHSHGGQVVLPVVGPPFLPTLGRKYPSGLYQVGNMLQYTNRGVGTTQWNIRINCRPEITVFTLRAG